MKIDKSWYIKPEGIPESISAGGVVVRKLKDKIYITLVRDKKFDDYMLPKGRVEKGEDLIAAAKREISEETGLGDLQLIFKLGEKERLTFEKDEWEKDTLLFICYQPGKRTTEFTGKRRGLYR